MYQITSGRFMNTLSVGELQELVNHWNYTVEKPRILVAAEKLLLQK